MLKSHSSVACLEKRTGPILPDRFDLVGFDEFVMTYARHRALFGPNEVVRVL
jgi:hypothetical protein